MYHLFRRDQKLSSYSTFGVGGPIRYLIEVHRVEQMQELIRFVSIEKIPYLVIGKGSNCLFSDKGFDGLVIVNKIDFLKDNGQGLFHVGAGFSFSHLGGLTAKKGFRGLEFACGIPGSVGGAVYMNAGAQGGDTAGCLNSVDYIDTQGNMFCLQKEALAFSYRTSVFQTMSGVICGATFSLILQENTREKQLQLLQYRIETQPYNEKSCGCIFRNPEGASAGMLIEKCGLKGFSIGGAQVSPIHANFIVNKNGATSQDILSLIDHVKKRVYEVSGVRLESEIRIISGGAS